MTTIHAVTPTWARDFNNKPRHCFEDKFGDRWLQGNINARCTTDHDPKLTGPTEWLRFVREFGALTEVNPFTSTDGRHFLLHEVDGHLTSDGRRTYCETYLWAQDEEPWGVQAVFRIFLANDEGWARIECYDKDLVGLCEQTLGEVERSYRMEVTR